MAEPSYLRPLLKPMLTLCGQFTNKLGHIIFSKCKHAFCITDPFRAQSAGHLLTALTNCH